MFEYLKKKHALLSIHIFNNTLGSTTNIIYFIHHQLSKILYLIAKNNKKNKRTNKRISELRKNGVSIVGNYKNINNLKKKFNYYFSNKRQKKSTRKDAGGYLFLKKKYLKNFSEEINNFIKSDLDKLLKQYYKSSYDLYWVEIIRSFPIKNHDDDKSLLFHFDDNPNSVLKTFVYLNDQDENSGAFKTLLKKDSRKLKKKGFLSYTKKDRDENQHMIKSNNLEKKVKIFKGKKGSILIFQNNIIHKGNLPIKKNRDLIVIETIPSTKTIDENKIKKALERNVYRDYPQNPFCYR